MTFGNISVKFSTLLWQLKSRVVAKSGFHGPKCHFIPIQDKDFSSLGTNSKIESIVSDFLKRRSKHRIDTTDEKLLNWHLYL